MILDGEITHCLLVRRCSVDAEKLLEANKILIGDGKLMLILMMRLILMLTPMVPWGTMKFIKSHTGADTLLLQKVAMISFCQMSWTKRRIKHPSNWLLCLQCSQLKNNVNIVKVAFMDTVQIMTSRSGSKITHHCIESIEEVQR